MRDKDYHIHSIYSDGSDSPKEIVEKAVARNMKAIALTDHDCIGGLEEARLEANKKMLDFVPGIELSVRYESTRQIHILGLDIDYTNSDFLHRYTAYRKRREKAVDFVLDELEKIGLRISKDILMPFSHGLSLDRQSIAKYLLNNGFAPTMHQAWVNYLDKIPNQEGELLSPIEAFEMIHAASGKAYIAHIHKPIGLYGYSESDMLQRLVELHRMGLDGIESHYPSYELEDLQFIRRAVEKIGLIECGGSDYHGAHRINVMIGD